MCIKLRRRKRRHVTEIEPRIKVEKLSSQSARTQKKWPVAKEKDMELECGPMPSLMVALPNIGGALCSTPQSLADAHY